MSKKKKKGRDISKLNDWAGFRKSLNEESERASAIVGAAFLDEYLRKLLASFMVDEKDAVDELLGNGLSETPLSSFGARITAAYCLGLITQKQRDALRKVKWVRNEFAHSLHGRSFEDDDIKKICLALEIPGEVKDNQASSRDRYILIVKGLVALIHVQAERIQKMRRVVPDKWGDVGKRNLVEKAAGVNKTDKEVD